MSSFMQGVGRAWFKATSGPSAARVGSASAQAGDVAHIQPAASLVQDEWEMADTTLDGRVIFTPYTAQQVDEASAELIALTQRDGSISGGSDISDGAAADDVIEHVDARYSRGTAATLATLNANIAVLSSAFQAANTLMKRPGLQRELLAALLEEPEAQRGMQAIAQVDMSDYVAALPLGAALLQQEAALGAEWVGHGAFCYSPPPPAAGGAPPLSYAPYRKVDVGGTQGQEPGGNACAAAPPENVDTTLSYVVDAVANLLQRVDGAFADLAGWLRAQCVAFSASCPGDFSSYAAPGPPGADGRQRNAEVAVGRTMMVMSVMMCLLMAQHPRQLRFA